MLRFGIAVGLSLTLLPVGIAQSSAFLEDWDLDASGEVVIVYSPGRDDAGAVDSELILADLRVGITADRVLDNGAKIGVRVDGRVQFDHPQRAGFSGQIEGGGFTGTGLAPRGAFTGLTLGGEAEDAGLRAAFETAFAYIDGGYGELLVGRDIGVARRFHEGAESVFRRHNVVNPTLDASGIASVLTRSDLSGPAAKISYATPRLLGLKIGVSYAPRANTRGLDRDPRRTVIGVDEPRLEHITEVGFNLSRRLSGSGVRVSTYGAFARASVETGPTRTDNGTVEVWSTGGRLERDGLSFGADWLTTDNGGGRYRAWSVSAGAEKWGLDWSASFGRSNDDLTAIEGEGASFAASKQFYEAIRFGIGVQTQRLNPDLGGSVRSTGPVIEMSLTY